MFRTQGGAWGPISNSLSKHNAGGKGYHNLTRQYVTWGCEKTGGGYLKQALGA